MKEAVEELTSLEDFIRGTRPKKQEAKELVEEVLRALMEKLNFMGFHFGMPDAPSTSSGLNADVSSSPPPNCLSQLHLAEIRFIVCSICAMAFLSLR